MIERRQHQRIENVKVKAHIYRKSGAGDHSPHTIVNLSRGGVLVHSLEEILVNEIVSISFDCSEIDLDCSIRIKAIAVRSEKEIEGYKVALKFINISNKDDRQIKQIIDYHKKITI